MRLPILPLRVLAGDLGVDLGRGQGSMPQRILNDSAIRPAFKQVRSEGMAQLVGCDVDRQPGLDQVAFEAPADVQRDGGSSRMPRKARSLGRSSARERVQVCFGLPLCPTSPPHSSDTCPPRIGPLPERRSWNRAAAWPCMRAGIPRSCNPGGIV